MMGHQARSEALFYYFRLEDQIPENHLLRLIDQHVGLIIHQNEPARQRARELVNTPEFAQAQRQRKKVEALFAELKNQIGLRPLRLRRLKFVREQLYPCTWQQ